MNKGERELVQTSPISGRVVEVNRELEKDPNLLAQKETSKNWIFRVKPIRLKTELENLLHGKMLSRWEQAVKDQLVATLTPAEFPVLQEGGWLEVRGRLSDYHGERRVWVREVEDLRRVASGQPVQPQLILSGEVDEAHEGLLVQVFAPAVSFRGRAFWVDDGSGEARVYVRESVGFDRPWIEVGEMWSVVGVVSQYVRSRPYVGGYRLLPRTESDLSNAPLLLPVTGRE